MTPWNTNRVIWYSALCLQIYYIIFGINPRRSEREIRRVENTLEGKENKEEEEVNKINCV